METVRTKTSASARTRSVAFVGLAIAIIAVSAWVTVPLGPIPFTLQMFAVTFAVVVLSPKEAIASIAGYLLLGAVGVPVFSGMRGGIGVLAGPTGGFLWGYLLGVAAAALFLYVVRTRLGVAGGKSAPKLTSAERAALSPGRRAATSASILLPASSSQPSPTRAGALSTWWWARWIWPRPSSRRVRPSSWWTFVRSWPPSSVPTLSAQW